jgi:PBP1b-binding outer membrane lipoprotein LpoB
MKKIFGLITVILILCAFFSGCSKNDATSVIKKYENAYNKRNIEDLKEVVPEDSYILDGIKELFKFDRDDFDIRISFNNIKVVETSEDELIVEVVATTKMNAKGTITLGKEDGEWKITSEFRPNVFDN